MMDLFRAVMVAEQADGYDDVPEIEYLEAWQTLVDTGVCWSLQGFFGRTATALLDAGLILPFPREHPGGNGR